MNKVLDTPYVYFEIKDDILFATYKKGTTIDLEVAKEIVRTRLAFTDNKDMLVLVMIEGFVTPSWNARKYISSPEGVKCLIAAAILNNNPFAAFIGKIFSSINRPKVIPVRVCLTQDRALAWLEDHRPKGNETDTGKKYGQKSLRAK